MTAEAPAAASSGAAGIAGPSGPAGAAGRRLGALSLAIVLLAALLLADRALRPSDGLVVQLSNRPWDPHGMTIGFVLDEASPLQPRDVVTAVDGVPLPDRPPRRDLRRGDVVRLTVERDGAVRQVDVRLGEFPLRAFLQRTWPSLAVLVTLLLVAAFVFHRRPRDPAARAVLLTATLVFTGTFAYLLGDEPWRLATRGPSVLDLLGETALALIWGAMAHFALVSPGTGLRTTWRRLAVLYTLPLALHAGYLAVTLPTARSGYEAAGRIAQVSLVPSAALPLATAALVVVSYRSTRDVTSRRRMRWVIGLMFACVLGFLLVWNLPFLLGLPVPDESLIALLYLPPTLALGAAILRYRLFDIEVILRRSLLYGSLTVSVVGVYLGVAWVLSQLPLAEQRLAAVLTGGVAGLSVGPLRNLLRRRAGRLIYGSGTTRSRSSPGSAGSTPRRARGWCWRTSRGRWRTPSGCRTCRSSCAGRRAGSRCAPATATPATRPAAAPP